MANNKIIYSLHTINKAVESIYKLLPHCQVVTFTGTLGAGKTTLIKHLLAHCGVKDTIVSPTFTYMVAYSNNKGEIFYHFDLYRINTLEDFINAGFGEYLYQPHSWAFIEWPEVIEPILTYKRCAIDIDYCGKERRLLSYNIRE